jgi:hypothetical protein
MIVRSLFLALLASGIAACTTEKLYSIDTATDIIKIPRPIVTQVIFEENTHTELPASEYPHDEKTDPCEGFALTEDEVKEFFRVAQIIWSYDTHSFVDSPCRVYGRVMLKDGRTGSFGIDVIRLGRLHTSDGLGINYYCNDCQNEKFEEACDLECIQKSLE